MSWPLFPPSLRDYRIPDICHEKSRQSEIYLLFTAKETTWLTRCWTASACAGCDPRSPHQVRHAGSGAKRTQRSARVAEGPSHGGAVARAGGFGCRLEGMEPQPAVVTARTGGVASSGGEDPEPTTAGPVRSADGAVALCWEQVLASAAWPEGEWPGVCREGTR
jgi:hypothetical protein